jgi:RimJ/RimL family protein N-acetyltransferase
MIETRRINIIPLELFEIKSLIEGKSINLYETYISEKNIKNYIKEAYENKIKIINKYNNLKYILTIWMCISKNNRDLVGEITTNGFPLNGRIEVAYNIEKKYRNRGYMNEILKAYIEWMFSQKFYYINSITAVVDKDNIASKKVLHKVGMKNVKNKYNIEVWKIRN